MKYPGSARSNDQKPDCSDRSPSYSQDQSTDDQDHDDHDRIRPLAPILPSVVRPDLVFSITGRDGDLKQ